MVCGLCGLLNLLVLGFVSLSFLILLCSFLKSSGRLLVIVSNMELKSRGFQSIIVPVVRFGAIQIAPGRTN